MGWIPNVLHRNIEYIRYWNRIMKMDDNIITKSVFNQDHKCRKSKTWCFYLSSDQLLRSPVIGRLTLNTISYHLVARVIRRNI